MKHASMALLVFLVILVMYKKPELAMSTCEELGLRNCIPNLYGFNNAETIKHMKQNCSEFCIQAIGNAMQTLPNTQKDVWKSRLCNKVSVGMCALGNESLVDDVNSQYSSDESRAQCGKTCGDKLQSYMNMYDPLPELDPNTYKKVKIVYARPAVNSINADNKMYLFDKDTYKQDVQKFVQTCNEWVKNKLGKNIRLHDEVSYLTEYDVGPFGPWVFDDTDLLGLLDPAGQSTTTLAQSQRLELNKAIVIGLGGDTAHLSKPQGKYNPNDIYIVLYDGGRHSKFVKSCGFVNVPNPDLIVTNDSLGDFYKPPGARGLPGATMAYVLLQGQFYKSNKNTDCQNNFSNTQTFQYLHYVFVHELFHALGLVRPQYMCHVHEQGLDVCSGPFTNSDALDHITPKYAPSGNSVNTDVLYTRVNVGNLTIDKEDELRYKSILLGTVEWKGKSAAPNVPEVWNEHNPNVNPEVCKNGTHIRHPSCYFVD